MPGLLLVLGDPPGLALPLLRGKATMKTDAELIAELRAAEEAATPGPWITGWGRVTQTKEDAKFIAACRQGVPALLRALGRIGEILDECGALGWEGQENTLTERTQQLVGQRDAAWKSLSTCQDGNNEMLQQLAAKDAHISELCQEGLAKLETIESLRADVERLRTVLDQILVEYVFDRQANEWPSCATVEEARDLVNE